LESSVYIFFYIYIRSELIPSLSLSLSSSYLLSSVLNHCVTSIYICKKFVFHYPDSFIAPSATLCGHVELYGNASIWYGVVINGTNKYVRIGQFSNIQDNTTIMDSFENLDLDHDGSAIVGHYVTVGHSCHLRACTIENCCLVGMGSILSDGSYMEEGSILGANSVLLPHDRIPSGQLWAGLPARFIRDFTEQELTQIQEGAIRYGTFARKHKETFYFDNSTAYIDAEKLGIDVGWKIHEKPL